LSPQIFARGTLQYVPITILVLTMGTLANLNATTGIQGSGFLGGLPNVAVYLDEHFAIARPPGRSPAKPAVIHQTA
jgi:hypothetical protein